MFGHTFQSRKYGFLYMYIVALPSFISCKGFGNSYKHKRRWYEKEASRFASEYFESYGIDWLNDVNKGEKDPDKQLYPIY